MKKGELREINHYKNRGRERFTEYLERLKNRVHTKEIKQCVVCIMDYDDNVLYFEYDINGLTSRTKNIGLLSLIIDCIKQDYFNG